MTGLSVVLIVVAIVGLVVVAMAVQSLLMTLRSLRETVDDLRRETLPAIAELRSTVEAANGELERVDALLDTAEDVSARVDATSKLTWLVVRNPLVKLASMSVSTERVARKLGRTDEPIGPLALESAPDRTERRGRRIRSIGPGGRRARKAG